MHPHRYTLEAWVTVKTDSEEWVSPEDDSYSEDFVIDTVNQVFPGSTGAYMAEAGHIFFFGKKNNPKAGLTQEESVRACYQVRRLATWMGEPARIRVRAISLSEASVIVESCKWMFKEDLRRARIELQKHASSTQHASTRSASARTFTRVAYSSGVVPGRNAILASDSEAPIPPYTSDDEGTATDATASPHRPRRRGHGWRHGREMDGSETDASGPSTGPGSQRFKKKSDVSSKVDLPKFGGKKGHAHDTPDAFRCWAQCIVHQRNYYEDEDLLSNILPSLSGDASEVYDWVVRSIHTPDGKIDLGVLLSKLREHYCGSLTFREQRYRIEHLRQGSREDAVDFHIHVGSAIEGLSKEWSKSITPAELDTLQYV